MLQVLQKFRSQTFRYLRIPIVIGLMMVSFDLECFCALLLCSSGLTLSFSDNSILVLVLAHVTWSCDLDNFRIIKCHENLSLMVLCRVAQLPLISSDLLFHKSFLLGESSFNYWASLSWFQLLDTTEWDAFHIGEGCCCACWSWWSWKR
jgi:hypothetical protein